MGNRAVITTEDKQIGVYLHWNGGRDSVEAILGYCKAKGYRRPELDNYGWAQLCRVAGLLFKNGLSVGIDTLENLDCDNFDNGLYIIRDWEIVGREFNKHGEQMDYDKTAFMLELAQLDYSIFEYRENEATSGTDLLSHFERCFDMKDNEVSNFIVKLRDTGIVETAKDFDYKKSEFGYDVMVGLLTSSALTVKEIQADGEATEYILTIN
jgi:hypothetical protein